MGLLLLPGELLLEIFAIGCISMFLGNRLNRSSNSPTIFQDISFIARPKEFAMESRLVCRRWWQLIQSTPTLWVTVVDLRGPRRFGTEGQSSYRIGQLPDGDSDLDIFLPSYTSQSIPFP